MKRRFLSLATVSLALAMSFNSTAMAAQSKYFTDVNDNHYGWSTEYVDYLCEKGIANGTGDNKYSPELSIERGDFIVLINNAFELTPVSDLSVYFSDVSKDMYYYNAIVNAKGNNIIKESGAFYPETPITRADAMTILYRAMSKNNLIKTTGSTDLSKYADGDLIKDIEVKNALGTLSKLGIVNGSNGYLNPLSTMTRAEMAVVFSRALQYAESLPVSTEKTEIDNTKVEAEDTEANEVVEASPEYKESDITDTLYLDGNPYTTANSINTTVKEETDENSAIIVTNGITSEINEAKLSVTASNMSAVTVEESSELEINDSKINALGANSVGVTIEDGSSVAIQNSNIEVKTEDSFAIVNEGELELSNTTLINNKKDSDGIIKIMNNASTTIEKSEISAEDATLIFIDSNEDDCETEITLTDSTFTGKKSSLFGFKNMTDITAVIENCKFDGLTNLFVNNYNSSKIKLLPTLDLTLKNQELEINIDTNDIFDTVIKLRDNSTLIGAVNDNNSLGYVTIDIDETSVWELTDDAYIGGLIITDEYELSQIIDNGYNIYYEKYDENNRWLNEEIEDLPYGGQLIPR